MGLFFLENYHYPFDLQVCPLLGTHGEGGGRELAPSRQILESTLQIHVELLKYYCRLMKYGDCTVNRWYKQKLIWYHHRMSKGSVTSNSTLVGMQS